MGKKRIVVTGAAGTIASKVLPDLGEHYELSLLDKRDVTRDGEIIEGLIKVDLMNRDRDAYREHFRGVDAVIHSGFVRAEDPADRFWAELDNVAMAYNIYQTCIEENVPRLVVISSNHAADYYEQHIRAGRILSIGPETYPLSDNYYGWAKIAYEALGFVFATGKVTGGKMLEVVQVRIGAPRETDIDSCEPGDLQKMHRDLGAYLSLRDEVQLLVKSIETEDIRDLNGVPFQVFYGVSANTHNFWSIENARRVIGYEPEDNSSLRFAEQVKRITGVE